MDLYKEILAHALTYGEVHVTFADQNPNISEIVGNKCYQALEKMKAIIHDDSLDDPECFMKIEHIILALEEVGSSGGFRHDFG